MPREQREGGIARRPALRYGALGAVQALLVGCGASATVQGGGTGGAAPAAAGGLPSVRDFGAAGDGSSDDTAAFAALAARGGVYRVPPGTYWVPRLEDVKVAAPLTLIADAPEAAVLRSGQNPRNPSRSLFKPVASLRLVNLTFRDCGAVVSLDGLGTVIPELALDACRFERCASPLYWLDGSGGAGGVARLAVRACHVEGCYRGVFLQGPNIRDASIAGNLFRDVGRFAVLLGSLDEADQPDTGRFVVADNHIVDVHYDGDANAGGIYLAGRDAVVSGNVIERVASRLGRDTEGIYVKLTAGVIAHNVLRDAGQSQAFIALKGSGHRPGHGPDGFAIVCSDNVLTASPERQPHGAGIWVQADDVRIAGNHFEGFTGPAVAGGTPVPLRNVAIIGNTVRNFHGYAAVKFIADAENLRIEDNTFDGFTGAMLGGREGAIRAIDLAAREGRRMRWVRIAGNRFLPVAAPQPGVTTAALRLRCQPGGRLTDARIADNLAVGLDALVVLDGSARVGRLTVVDNELEAVDRVLAKHGDAQLETLSLERNLEAARS